VRRALAGQPASLPRRALSAAADQAERSPHSLAAGRPLLAKGPGGAQLLLGDDLASAAALAAQPGAGDRLPGDVCALLQSPRRRAVLGSVGGARTIGADGERTTTSLRPDHLEYAWPPHIGRWP